MTLFTKNKKDFVDFSSKVNGAIDAVVNQLVEELAEKYSAVLEDKVLKVKDEFIINAESNKALVLSLEQQFNTKITSVIKGLESVDSKMLNLSSFTTSKDVKKLIDTSIKEFNIKINSLSDKIKQELYLVSEGQKSNLPLNKNEFLQEVKKSLEKDLEKFKKEVSENVNGKLLGFTGGSGYAQIYNQGVKIKRRNSINFIGASVADNPATGQTEVTISGEGGGGAPTDATYLTLSSNANLSNERVFAVTGAGLTLLDSGVGATLSLSSNLLKKGILVTFDGGGSVLVANSKVYLTIPFAMTITSWTIIADQSGSCVIDVWKDTYANYPPTVADTITGSEKPTLSSTQKNQDNTLSTWTTSVAAGDTLIFNVDSATTVTRVTLLIEGVLV